MSDSKSPVVFGVPTLMAMVVGSMVGAGIFSLPARFAGQTGVAGALISWAIAGAGMLMLAFVFQSLAVRKPDLDAGVFAYAKAGFGEYLGFYSAFGYWASSCVGNVTYWILIMSTVGALWPALGEGDTLVAFVLSSACVWIFYLLVRRGVKEATAINRIVTIAKLVPIIVFVLLVLFLLDAKVFADNFQGTGDVGGLAEQVRGTMLATVFVFLGVEGASVYSRHARRREDVGRATVLGFLSVLAIFASVTIVSYGVLPMEEIADLRQPSMAGVLEAAVGPWGKAFVSIGLIISVLGAYLAWTLMASEVLFMAAKERDMPKVFARLSEADVPRTAVFATSLAVQVLLLITVFSEDAFTFALDLTSALSLIPFLLAAGYAVRIAMTRDSYEQQGDGRNKDLVVASLATIYTIVLLFAAGPKFLLISFLLYAPSTALFVIARREQNRRAFVGVEWVILAVSVIGAVAGLIALVTGAITI
ncbi:MAG: basic amino acid/polyamine antiporter [Actinophytocola sp.]|uniref:basic amino acid/polyamine antiporter n=1 Tax=Actinophytocola sp. TaxID=1872138 RepID=UPI003C750883